MLHLLAAEAIIKDSVEPLLEEYRPPRITSLSSANCPLELLLLKLKISMSQLLCWDEFILTDIFHMYSLVRWLWILSSICCLLNHQMQNFEMKLRIHPVSIEIKIYQDFLLPLSVELSNDGKPTYLY